MRKESSRDSRRQIREETDNNGAQRVMEDEKRSETSPKPSQPTPFSIADILSRETSCADPRRCDLEKIQAAVFAPTKRHSREHERADNEHPDGGYEHDQVIHYPRLPTPELGTVHELDILRRNLAQVNLSNFGNAHLTQGTFKHHLEALGNLTAYQPVKEPMETSHRQQDEALDMSKNKYLGGWYCSRELTLFLITRLPTRQKFADTDGYSKDKKR